MVDMAFFRGGLGRWLPPSVPPVDEAVLLRRCWELLVLDRPGTARLAVFSGRTVASTRCSPTGPKQWSSPSASAPVATPPPVTELATQ